MAEEKECKVCACKIFEIIERLTRMRDMPLWKERPFVEVMERLSDVQYPMLEKDAKELLELCKINIQPELIDLRSVLRKANILEMWNAIDSIKGTIRETICR